MGFDRLVEWIVRIEALHADTAVYQQVPEGHQFRRMGGVVEARALLL
jgi:hypothetical protein